MIIHSVIIIQSSTWLCLRCCHSPTLASWSLLLPQTSSLLSLLDGDIPASLFSPCMEIKEALVFMLSQGSQVCNVTGETAYLMGSSPQHVLVLKRKRNLQVCSAPVATRKPFLEEQEHHASWLLPGLLFSSDLETSTIHEASSFLYQGIVNKVAGFEDQLLKMKSSCDEDLLP